MGSYRFSLLSAVLIGTLASQAQAVSLAPGGTVNTLGATPVPVGTQVGSVTSSTFAIGDFTATLNTQALLTDDGVAFLYQVTNNATSTTSVISAVEVNFNTYTTNVDFTNSDPDSAGSLFIDGTVATSTATRSAGTGTSITFNFTGVGIGAGESSEVFFVQTNASSFQNAFVTLTGMSGSSNVAASLGPNGPVAVPEPSMLQAIAFTALPLVGLARVVRRRRASAPEVC